jgi:hypothetical protein
MRKMQMIMSYETVTSTTMNATTFRQRRGRNGCRTKTTQCTTRESFSWGAGERRYRKRFVLDDSRTNLDLVAVHGRGRASSR